MKLTQPLSTLGLLVIAATSVICGPAAANAAADTPPPTVTSQVSPDAAASPLVGKFVLWAPQLQGYHGVVDQGDGSIATNSGVNGGSRADAIAAASEAVFPALGATGPIRIGGRCLVPGIPLAGNEIVALGDCSSDDVYNVTVDRSGRLEVGSLSFSTISRSDGNSPTRLTLDESYGRLGLQLDLTLYLAPTVSVPTPTVPRGHEVEVEASFNADASGQRIDIVPPAGTVITAVEDPAFAVSARGLTGTLPLDSTSVRFTLRADAEAPLGTARGGQIMWGSQRIRFADFSAEINLPAPPSVTVSSPPVTQGTMVEVVLTFNETALGDVEIVVPEWVEPYPRFEPEPTLVWDDSLPGYRGTITRANLVTGFWMPVRPDAPVGVFEARVVQASSGLDSVWPITVISSRTAPLVVESPKVGDTINETVPVFRGTAQPGARVEIRGAWGDLLGSVDRVDASGAWSIAWNKSVLPARYVGGTVKQLVGGAVTDTFIYDFTVGRSDIAPLVVTSPKVGETTTDSTPVFTGTAQPGARVEIRGAWGDVLGSVDRVDASGAWSITWNKGLLPNRYAGGTVKQFVDGIERNSFVYDFTLVQSKLVVTSPQVGDTITGTRPVFTGTANPGAQVQITGAWGTDLGSAIADARTGEWTITWPRDYLPARYSGGTVTETVGGKVVGTTIYDFTLNR